MTAMDQVPEPLYELADAVPVRVGELFAVVDSADFPVVRQHDWRALHGHNGKVYAYFMKGRTFVYMHRLIAGTPDDMETDHRNGNGLDNRRSNLRVATPSENRANMGKPRRPDGSNWSSRFKGVSWDKSRNRWQAKINTDGVHRNLGRFDDEIAAAAAYDTAALAHWGQFAKLNFPVTTKAAS